MSLALMCLLALAPQEPSDLAERVGRLEKAGWDPARMLSFSSPDGNFTAKVGGRLFFTYRHIFDRDDATGGSADTFAVDTARIELDGTFYKQFLYRVHGEAQNQTDSGRFRMKDAYLGWNGLPWLAVQAGQMKTPWSQEETTSSKFGDFAEKSILNRLAPAHDVGLLFKGDFADKVVEWNLGVFNGALGRDGGRNATDPNDEKDVVGRLFVTPFKNSGEPLVEQLRVGFDFTAGDRDTTAIGTGFTTGDLGGAIVNPFSGAAPAADGLQTRWLVNFSWLYDRFSLRAEYGWVVTELVDTAAEDEFETTGANLQATWLLTGEAKPLEGRLKPAANFNPAEGAWGAFELAARFALLDTSDGEDAGVVTAGTNGETREFTAGLNWHMTPNVVLRINWEHFIFDEDVVLATGDDPSDKQDVFYVRWQIDF